MTKIVFIICLAVLTFGVSRQSVYGCSCGSLTDVENVNYKRWLKKFDGAVFIGRVTKMEETKGVFKSEWGGLFYQTKVTFEVEQLWKGVKTPEAIVYTAPIEGSCGVTYVKGEPYFVVARTFQNKLRTDLCSDLNYREMKQPFIAKLGEGKKPVIQADKP